MPWLMRVVSDVATSDALGHFALLGAFLFSVRGNLQLLVALLVRGPLVMGIKGIDEPKTSGSMEQFPQAPLRPGKPKPPPCNLIIITRSQPVHLELGRARRYLQGQGSLIDMMAGLEGVGGEPLLKEEIYLAMIVSGEQQMLSENEKLMLWRNKGKWERWIALLEIYCLPHLLQSSMGSLLLPHHTASSFLDKILPLGSPRCVEPIDEPELTTPIFQSMSATPAQKLEKKTDTARATPRIGLGNCPGVLFIPSGPALWQRRELVRNTWLNDYPGLIRPLGVAPADLEPPSLGCMDYFFLMGWPTTAELRVRTMKEKARYADLIVDCSIQDGVPHEAGLQHKFFRGLQLQQQLFPHAEYFVRASDDTYLNVHRIMSLIDFHHPRMLYLGRQVSQQRYNKNWSFYSSYLETYDHDRIPSVMVGDVVALSHDLIRILLASQDHLQYWAHFDDTLGIWLSGVAGVRRLDSLRVDRQWIEFRDILQGALLCPPMELVVAHCPAWKDWQNILDAAVREHEREEHDAYIEFMMKTFSAGVRASGDPCHMNHEDHKPLLQRMLDRIVRNNWQVGRRISGFSHDGLTGQLDVLHGSPVTPYQGHTKW